MNLIRRLIVLLGIMMSAHVTAGNEASDAVWHNKIPAASSEPALDIDKNPDLVHHYADNQGTQIHYVTLGSNKNPLMVFVHGFPDFWYTWRNQMQAFSANYQVVAIDLRGYDASDKPQGVDNYNIPVLLDDLRAVIDAERRGRKVILVGHDWGAALSWLFTGQHPDLVERLVVLSVPHPGAIRKEFLPWNHPLAQAKVSAYATHFLARGKGDNLTPQDLAYWVADPRVKDRYVRAFAQSSITSLMAYYKANYSLSQFALNLFDPTMRKIYAAKILCPVLHVQGSEEHHALPSTLDLEKAWLEAPGHLTIDIVPGVGHFIQHEAPDYLNQAISSWLRESPH